MVDDQISECPTCKGTEITVVDNKENGLKLGSVEYIVDLLVKCKDCGHEWEEGRLSVAGQKAQKDGIILL